MQPAQIQTLKTFVAASVDAAIVAARTAGATYDLMNLLNAPNVPATSAWRVAVPAVDIDAAANYTTYDTLTQGKRDEWDIFLKYAPRNMGLSKNRSVVTDVWGAALASSLSEAILLVCVENASVAEFALGGSTKTTGTVSALLRSFAGQVSQDDCVKILAP